MMSLGLHQGLRSLGEHTRSFTDDFLDLLYTNNTTPVFSAPLGVYLLIATQLCQEYYCQSVRNRIMLRKDAHFKYVMSFYFFFLSPGQ